MSHEEQELKWIKCSDRFPEVGWVLVVFDGKVREFMYYGINPDCKCPMWVDCSGFTTYDITHWQPLPEPPREEE